MNDEEPARYSIRQLAELGGVSRRTVRYYVQRGLLDTPDGLGRGSHYTDHHLDRLIEIRQLQETGVSLDEIAGPARKTERSSRSVDLRVGSWVRIEVADGIELHLRDLRLDCEGLLRLRTAIMAAIEKTEGK